MVKALCFLSARRSDETEAAKARRFVSRND